MNMQVRFKVFGVLIILAILLGSMQTSIVRSQMGGGYTCGQWHFYNSKPAGWWFTPYGSQPDQSWYLRYLGGSEAPWGFELDGSYMKIWNPEFDPQQNIEWMMPPEIPMLVNMGSYETTSTCEPTINFWADNETIMAGECTTIHWNADASGLDSANLDGNDVNPGAGESQVCPSKSTSYILRVKASGSEFSKTLSINVIQPTSTPIPVPTSTPIPVPTRTPVSPTSTPIPPTQPSATTVPALLPPDGPRSPSGFWCFLPGFCVQAAEVNTTCHPQCVETANRLRSDLPIWGTVMTSDQILAVAESEPIFKFQNEMQRVRVRGSNEAPQSGDLVIWPHDCDYAWSGGGHIGYVTNGDPFSITDTNWDGACGERTNKQIGIKSCMRFITSPYPINSSNATLTPAVIPTPIPGIVPTPSGQPSNLFQWIIDLFK